MSVESVTYISDLVPANPLIVDPVSQGENHIQNIKSGLKNSFPNITGAVTATQGALNAVAAALSGETLTIPTVTTGGGITLIGQSAPAVALRNIAGNLIIGTGTGVHVGIDTVGNIYSDGTINTASKLQENGAPLIPRGVVVMWSGSLATVPTGWALCDGANGTPDLRGLFVIGAGGAYPYAATGGSVVYNGSTDAQGSHAHSGSTAYGGSHYHIGSTDAQGYHGHSGSTDQHQLTVGEMPAHTHSITAQTNGGGGASAIPDTNSGSGSPDVVTQSAGGNAPHGHGIQGDGLHAHALLVTPISDHLHTISADGIHAHAASVSGLPPYIALGFIMKL